MAAAKTRKIKATPQLKAKTSPRQVEANRSNSRRSCGPRTDAGKGRSKYNALKHGRTAESTLLPGDDASAFQARRLEIIEGMQPRNPIEGILLEQIARCEWKSRRGDLSASARLSSQLREESQKTAFDDKDEVIALGQHLLAHPPFPLPVSSPNDKGYLGKAPLADVPGDPHHPARLVLKLEQTVCGCDWLLGRWAGLKLRLDIGGLWLMVEGYEMVRLMGKYVIDMANDYELQMLMLANICLAADVKPKNDGKASEEKGPMTVWEQVVKYGVSEGPFHAFVEPLMACSEPWAHALANRPLERLAPENVDEARQWLKVAMDAKLKRLTRIRAERLRSAEADRAEAPARLALETGTEGDRLRRYDLSRDRVLLRTVGEFVDVRKASIAGTFNLLDYDLDELTDLDDPFEPQASGHAAPLADSDLSRRGESEVDTSEPIDEPCGPIAAVKSMDEVDVEAEIDRETAAKLVSDEIARLVPIRVEELRKLNEECQKEEHDARAAPRRARRRAPGEGTPRDRKTRATKHDQEAGCGEKPILRNEANLSVVNSHSSVVSGPLSAVDSDPSVVSSPSSVVSGPLPVVSSTTAGHVEPAAAKEPAASGPDPVSTPKTETSGRSESGSTGGAKAVPVPNRTSEHQAEIERRASIERLGEEIARQAVLRSENIRKLGEQQWKDAEAAELAHRARQRGHPNGNPGNPPDLSPRT